jgi:hypothetical protein
VILTAQHVQAQAGAEGINAFCRLHGPYEWTDIPPEDLPRGELVHQAISIPPGGNSVRSYLDVIAPDETSTHEIRSAIVPFIEQSRGHALPWMSNVGQCTFRFGVEAGLHNHWPEEFRQLLLAALTVRRAA